MVVLYIPTAPVPTQSLSWNLQEDQKQYLVTMNLKIKVELYVWRAVILVLMTTATPSNLLIIPE